MGGCRCSYKNCKSATKTTENVHFFHYPVKHTERCRKWIENAAKPSFFDLAEDQLRNKVVCELHFEDKCFTNIQRKRLLHDAVPTLDVGCEEEKSLVDQYKSRHYDNVQVLPANEDRTIFTVDTDSMQNIPESEEIESYIYRNGTLVPLLKNESTDQELVYAIDDSDMNVSVTSQANGNEVYFSGVTAEEQESEGNFHIVYNDCFSSASKQVTAKPPKAANGASGTSKMHHYKTNIMEVSKHQSNKQLKTKKFAQQMKHHSREIASIKRLLKYSLAQKTSKRASKISALNFLRSQLPPTLFSVVSYAIRSESASTLSDEEIDFFKTFYTTSPAVFEMFKDKYCWKLPDPNQFVKTNPETL